MGDIEFFPEENDPKKMLKDIRFRIDNISLLRSIYVCGWKDEYLESINHATEYLKTEAENAVYRAMKDGVHRDEDIYETFCHVVDTFGLYSAAGIVPSDESSRHDARNRLIMDCLYVTDQRLSSGLKDYKMTSYNNALMRNLLDDASKNGIAGEIFVKTLNDKYRDILVA